MNTKGLIVIFVLILVAGCTSSHRNYSVKENYSTANAPFDSLIIHFNYGESAPDTIVEWALYKNGDLKRRMWYGGKYAGDSCKIQVIKGEKQQTIQHLAHELFIAHSCPDIIKIKSNRVSSDCGEYCVNVRFGLRCRIFTRVAQAYPIDSTFRIRQNNRIVFLLFCDDYY